jgi:hypothetical protein
MMIASNVTSTYSLSKSKSVLRPYEEHKQECLCYSELEFEDELDGTGAADLVEGVESSASGRAGGPLVPPRNRGAHCARNCLVAPLGVR